MSSSSDRELKRQRIVAALKNRKPTIYEGEDPAAPEAPDDARIEGQVRPVTIELIGKMVDQNPDEALAVFRRWMSQ